MNEVPSGIVTECESIADQAQPERENIIFIVSSEAAQFVRSSVEEFQLRFDVYDSPLLLGVGDGFFPVPHEKFVGAQFSQREMEAINTISLLRIREMREILGEYPEDLTDLLIQLNSSYMLGGGQPSQKYLDFCGEFLS